MEANLLTVTVDQVAYKPEASTPIDRPYCFVYYITIHNDADRAVSIRGRKWVIRNDRGRMMVIEGEGVVGELPYLKPGEQFSYNSFHLVDTAYAHAEGSFIGIDDNGEPVIVRIPKFEMRVPRKLGA